MNDLLRSIQFGFQNLDTILDFRILDPKFWNFLFPTVGFV